MKKKILFLLFLLLSVFINLDYIKANCYQYCKNGDCISDSKEFKCYYVTYNKGNKTFEYIVKNADDTFKSNSVRSVQEVYMNNCINNISGTSYNEVSDMLCNSSVLSGNYVYCGQIGKIHKKIPELTSWFITIVSIGVPVILVIMGVIDFVKAITSQKEDEIKKGQQNFIKRLITAFIIFFVVAIVKLVIGLVSSGPGESKNILDCVECFINNKCS